MNKKLLLQHLISQLEEKYSLSIEINSNISLVQHPGNWINTSVVEYRWNVYKIVKTVIPSDLIDMSNNLIGRDICKELGKYFPNNTSLIKLGYDIFNYEISCICRSDISFKTKEEAIEDVLLNIQKYL